MKFTHLRGGPKYEGSVPELRFLSSFILAEGE